MKKLIIIVLMLIGVSAFSQVDKGSFYLGFKPMDTTIFNIGGMNLVTGHTQEYWVQDGKYYKVEQQGIVVALNIWDRVWTDTLSNRNSHHISEHLLLIDATNDYLYKNETIYQIVGNDTTIIPTNMNIWRMLIGVENANCNTIRDSIVKCMTLKYELEQ